MTYLAAIIGPMTSRMTQRELDRFNSKWERQGDCLIWTNSLDRDGYGTFFFRGANRRAHRVAWYIANGEIPDDMVINHVCRNRACVNHQHLGLTTKSENVMRDSVAPAYINSQKTTCPAGHPYDKTVTWSGKTQRICSICRNAKANERKKRRQREGKTTLRV